MKFLHAADIHLDSPLFGLERYEGAPVELIRGATRRALENLVRLAIHERVDFVVISGDLYDGDWRDFNTGMFFIRQMAKLRDAGIHVYLIAGNHDAINTMTRKLRLPENPSGDGMMFHHDVPETRRLDHLEVAIHGRSFASQAETRNLVPEYPIPIPNFFNVGMLHTSLNGSEEHDTYAPCLPSDLRGKGYQYWALGHIHKRSLLAKEGSEFLRPPSLYSGNPQGRHIRESGPRGCFIVEVDQRHEMKIEFHALDVFRWEVCHVTCSETSTADDVFEQVRKQLHSVVEKHQPIPLGVRIILDGATRAHQQLSSHRAETIAEIRSAATIVSDGKIWIEQVKFSTSYPRKQAMAFDVDGPLEELVRHLDELPYNTESLQALAEELKDLIRKLPSELTVPSDGIRLDRIDWLQEVVRDIKPMLLDRLKG